jgi:hypothetical protein
LGHLFIGPSIHRIAGPSGGWSVVRLKAQ